MHTPHVARMVPFLGIYRTRRPCGALIEFSTSFQSTISSLISPSILLRSKRGFQISFHLQSNSNRNTFRLAKMMGLWNGLGLGLGKRSFVSNDGGGDASQKPVRNWRMGKEAYEAKMAHHAGMKQLWETKWRFPVRSTSRKYPSEPDGTIVYN